MNIPESNIRNMLKAISNGNHVLNEFIKIYQNKKSNCPDCQYDPVRKESTNYNCQTCGGEGVVITESFTQISASVEQDEDFKYDFSKAGKFVDGQIYVTLDNLELTTVLNVGEKYDLNDYNQMKAFIEQYDYIIWKGAKYNISKFEPGFLQGNLYEIGLTLSLMG